MNFDVPHQFQTHHLSREIEDNLLLTWALSKRNILYLS
jgi:hypothetical protein